MKKEFLCIWSAPTYAPLNRIEGSDSLIGDENRGFDDVERNQMDSLGPLEMIEFEDLKVVRIK